MVTRYIALGIAGLLCVGCQQALPEIGTDPETPSTRPFPQVTRPAEVLAPEADVSTDIKASTDIEASTEAGVSTETNVTTEAELETESDALGASASLITTPIEETEAEAEQSERASETLVTTTEERIPGNIAGSIATSAEVAIELCRELGEKLSSVNESECLQQKLLADNAKSALGRALAVKDFGPIDAREPLGKVLVIGGIHGDEFSSVSVVFKWMEILRIHHSGLFDWRFIPVGNPDGLLRSESQRQNANGVDLNRNFPTSDWSTNAREYWINKAERRARRYPGEFANSEPETQWLVSQIEHFQPDVIVSMHAPYHLVDYDGPPRAPDQLGSLYLRRLGVYPGSLGNYAGVDLNIPVVTVELASAGIMPSEGEISDMWDDLVGWLRTKLSETHAQLN